MMERFCFVGSHSTGKTTLSSEISELYGLPLINEVARKELVRSGITLDQIRSSMSAVEKYQQIVWKSQIEEEEVFEKNNETFISDRSFDNLAYWIEYSFDIQSLIQSTEFINYINKWKQSNSTIFFVRPETSFIKDDGVRSRMELGLEDVGRIDGIIRAMLEIWGLKYIPIKGTNLKDRMLSVMPFFYQKSLVPKSER